jgi:hypothetical protein
MRIPGCFLVLALIGASTGAHAVMLNQRGEGQALVFPYYTVNKGLDTLVSFDNDSGLGKLVKVRFVEGYNGRTVFDFNVYLAPHDGWIGALTGDATGGAARLISNDRSCTRPAITFPATFTSSAYDGTLPAYPADGGPSGVARTREGHFEVIAIGDIPAESTTEAAVRAFRCADIPADPSLLVPKPTLFGSSTLVDVANGYFYGYNADALTGFTDTVLSATPGPTLADANSSDSASEGGALATVFDDDGRTMMVDYARGIDAVTAVYMAGAVTNEFTVLPALGASTDWVLTFPTKRFYVDKALYPSAITQPFQDAFAAPGASVMTASNGVVPLDHDGSLNNPRCAGIPDDTCIESLVQRFRYESNVIPFSRATNTAPSSVLGSMLFPPFDIANVLPVAGHPELGAGWVHFDFVQQPAAGGAFPIGSLAGGQRILPSGERVAIELRGAPATGFMAYNIVNANAAPGKLANYGGIFPHRIGAARCLSGETICTSP